MRLRIHGDGPYVKVYLNEQRVANVPSAAMPRSNKVFIEMAGYPAGEGGSWELTPTLLSAITINAGGSTLYDALVADGRVVTQGILFDTGSDRIRPESTPTLSEIADMLKQNAELRLAIEGHMDNTGDAAANQKALRAARRGGQGGAGEHIRHRRGPAGDERARPVAAGGVE